MRLGGEKEGRAERIRLFVLIAVLLGGFFAFQQLAPSLDIEGWLEDLAADLGDLTYLLVGLLAFAETGAFVGLVFPGETAVIIGGALAGQGQNSVVLMLAIVWFCAWAGDSVSFLLGRRLGREFVLKHGPKVRITEARFGQVETYFQRHGGKTILIGRFIGLVRALAPFIAGSSGMQYRAFLPYSVLGTGLWAATFTLLGYFISENINQATELASRGIFVFGAVVGIVVAIVLAVRFLRVRENRQRLARRMEGVAVLRPLVALGRRIEPQARFLWHRVTPGGLGLEFTTPDGGARGGAVRARRLRLDRLGGSGADAGRRRGDRRRRRASRRLAHRHGQGRHRPRLDPGDPGGGADRGRPAGDPRTLDRGLGAGCGTGDLQARRAGAQGGRSTARGPRAGWSRRAATPIRADTRPTRCSTRGSR